jgi:hypothetical protein
MSIGSDSAVTGPIETIAKGPRQRSWVALGAAIVGTLLTIGGFSASIVAALVDSGSGAGVTLVVFLVGIALDLAGIVLAVVTLVRSGRRRVPVIAIAVALIPALVIALLAISVRI